MTFKRVFVAAFLLIAVGIGCLANLWKGSAGFVTGFPLSVTSVTLTGAANGGWALLGFFATLLGFALLVVAFVLVLIEPGAREDKPLAKAAANT